jgi:hypothetical protein
MKSSVFLRSIGLLSTGRLHGGTSLNVELFITTAVRISDPASTGLVKCTLHEIFIVHRSYKGVPVIQIEVPLNSIS